MNWPERDDGDGWFRWPANSGRTYATRCVVCGAERRLPFDGQHSRAIDPYDGASGAQMPTVDLTGTLHLWADEAFAVFCSEHSQEESVTAFRLAEWKLHELPVDEALARQTADHG